MAETVHKISHQDQSHLSDIAVLKRIVFSVIALVALIGIATYLINKQLGDFQAALFQAMKLVTHIDIQVGGVASWLFLISAAGGIITIYIVLVIINIFFMGKLKKSFAEGRILKKITELSNHYIVCGGGSLGYSVAQSLQKKGMQVVVLEADNEKVAELTEEGVLALEGDCFEKSYLVKVGIMKARAVICCLNDDGDNLLVTLLVKEINPGAKVIAEATFQKYISQLKRAGADEVIVPKEIGGVYMAKVATQI